MLWQVANFAFSAVGAHALGPARFGVLAAAMALLSFTGPLLAAVQAAASREASTILARRQLQDLPPLLRYYGSRLAVGALALSVLTAAASVNVSRLFNLGSPWFVVIVGLTIPIFLANHLLGGLLQGIERFKSFALESVLEGFAKASIGFIAMGFIWRSAIGGLVAVALSGAVGLIVYLVVTVPLLRSIGVRSSESPVTEVIADNEPSGPPAGRRSAAKKPEVARYSATALVTYGLLAVLLSSDTLVAKHYLGDHQAGLYVGISLTGKIAYFVASSLFVVAFPLFSRHHDEGVSARRWVVIVATLVCAAAGLVVAVLAVEPSWVVLPLLGDRYRSVYGYAPWMAAVFGLYALGFLACVYLLARKRHRVMVVPAIAVVVQFGAYFVYHSSITQLIVALGLGCGVLTAGGVLQIALGRSGRSYASRGQHAGPRARSRRLVPAQRGAWRDDIVAEIAHRVGPAPVLLAGSRALGTAQANSDYDIAVVLPLLRIPGAAPRLSAAARHLSASLGADVSVNPVPRYRMSRPGGSLFARKLRAEAVVLAAPRNWALRREPLSGVTDFAAASILLSAVRSLLEAFDTTAVREGPDPSRARHALGKAALHTAQVNLLRSGRYASDLREALDLLSASSSRVSGEVAGIDLATDLKSGLSASDVVDGFLRVRTCVLRQLAAVGEVPLSQTLARSLIRNAQYAALARLRGRCRWRVALRSIPVEVSLAAVKLALLRALDPGSADGVDGEQFQLALRALPRGLSLPGPPSWESVRDLVLAEWPEAHPLVGILA